MEHLIYIEDKLIESIYENIELITPHEMGEMIDMIKDIEKALYYHCMSEEHDCCTDYTGTVSGSKVSSKTTE